MTAKVEVKVKVTNEKEADIASAALQKLALHLTPEELQKVATAAANPLKKSIALKYL